MADKIYIIGAGIAGLTAAYYASKKNIDIEIFEASPFAGGRCRSYFDEQINYEVNNGNHLVLQSNNNCMKLIDDLNIKDNFNFYSGKFKILDNGKYLTLNPLNFFRKNIFKLLLESTLNTEIEKADKSIFYNVIRKILFSAKGIAYILPKETWGRSLIEPLTKNLNIQYNRSVKKIVINNNIAEQIIFFDGSTIDCSNLKVILATPPYSAEKILEKDLFPQEYSPIINIHFLIEEEIRQNIIGITDSSVDWIFCNKNIISTTKSAAERYMDLSEEQLIKTSWNITSKVLNIKNYISVRIIKEKRATYACLKNISRPTNDIGIKNLRICGDYTDTDLPATIEGAIISGKKASN